MSRRNISPATQASSSEPWQTPAEETAKVALVEPVREGSLPPLSLARPKLGRVPEKIERIAEVASMELAREEAFPHTPTTAAGFFSRRTAAETPKVENKSENSNEPAVVPVADLDHPRVWDSRFALLFVMLLIGVNLGLVALVHNGHKSATSVATTVPPAISPLDSSPSLAVTPPATTPAPVSEAVPVKPEPTYAPAPTSQLKDLPGLAPAAGIPAPAPAPATTQAQPQDLLSIINKE